MTTWKLSHARLAWNFLRSIIATITSKFMLIINYLTLENGEIYLNKEEKMGDFCVTLIDIQKELSWITPRVPVTIQQ